MPPNSLRRTTETLEMLGRVHTQQQQSVPTRTNISSRGTPCPVQQVNCALHRNSRQLLLTATGELSC